MQRLAPAHRTLQAPPGRSSSSSLGAPSAPPGDEAPVAHRSSCVIFLFLLLVLIIRAARNEALVIVLLALVGRQGLVLSRSAGVRVLPLILMTAPLPAHASAMSRLWLQTQALHHPLDHQLTGCGLPLMAHQSTAAAALRLLLPLPAHQSTRCIGRKALLLFQWKDIPGHTTGAGSLPHLLLAPDAT